MGNYSVLYSGYQYPFGNTSVSGANLYRTGQSASTMKYGISDLAGNLWEWSDELSTVQTTGQYKVLRGGAFNYTSSSSPVCYRYTQCGIVGTYRDVGFRVVLYMY